MSRLLSSPSWPVHRFRSARAFSLVELLVVVGIIAMLAALATPAFNQIQSAEALSRAGQILGDQIILARQEAMTKNRKVEVRLVEVPETGGEKYYRGVQLWLHDEMGIPSKPVTKFTTFPGRVAIDPAYSPLLANLTGTTNFSGTTMMKYQGFVVRSSGALEGAVNTDKNYLTVRGLTDMSKPVTSANYYAVRVNPVTGRLSIHRP